VAGDDAPFFGLSAEIPITLLRMRVTREGEAALASPHEKGRGAGQIGCMEDGRTQSQSLTDKGAAGVLLFPLPPRTVRRLLANDSAIKRSTASVLPAEPPRIGGQDT